MGRSRSASRSNSRGRSASSSGSEPEGFRVHIGDVLPGTSTHEIERVFSRFGPTAEVWMARNPPCFAFVVYKYKEDAEEAVHEMNGATLAGARVRVSLALPRTRGRRRGTFFNADMRCYQCGERGHFSRECYNRGRNFRSSWRRSRTPPRRRRYSSSRSRSRSRSTRSRSAERNSRGKRRDSGDAKSSRSRKNEKSSRERAAASDSE